MRLLASEVVRSLLGALILSTAQRQWYAQGRARRLRCRQLGGLGERRVAGLAFVDHGTKIEARSLATILDSAEVSRSVKVSGRRRNTPK